MAPQEIENEIKILNQRVVDLSEGGLYQQALAPAKRSYDLAKGHLNEASPTFITSVNNLAAVHHCLSNYGEAKELYQLSLEIERSTGEDDPDVATILHNLGVLECELGEYVSAEGHFQEALKINRQQLEDNHPNLGVCLTSLADLYRSLGDYARAESFYREARDYYDVAQHQHRPEYANAIDGLGLISKLRGNYAEAERCYMCAQDILRSTVGENHPSYAASLSNLADVYESIGSYERAKELYQQALWGTEQVFGRDHPEFANGLNNLGLIYLALGEYETAEPLFQWAVKIARDKFGELSSQLASYLSGFAEVCAETGRYSESEDCYRKVLEIQRRVLGERHPRYLKSLSNLGKVYQSTGNVVEAEPLLRQALETRLAVLGPDDPDILGNFVNLAVICVSKGCAAEGLQLMQKAVDVENRIIGQIFSIGSETQRMRYLTLFRRYFEAFVSLVDQQFSKSDSAVGAALDLVLRRKAIGAEVMAIQHEAILRGRYPVLESKLRELVTTRMQISQAALAGPGKEGVATHQRLLEEWNKRKEDLEAELAREVPEMNITGRLQAVDRRSVAGALPDGSILVEFVRCHGFDFNAVPASGERQWKPARYVAFVLSAREPESPQIIDLKEADRIDQMVAAFRTSISSDSQRFSRHLVLSRQITDEAVSDFEGSSLRAAIFDPLIPALGQRRRLFLAADGELAHLPFEVLPIGDGSRLIDEYQISYLSVGRDVLHFGAACTRTPSASIVAADPDFDLGGANAALNSATTDSRRSRDIDGRTLHFTRLSGTLEEGRQIADMLGVPALLHGDVLEAKLKACQSPQILHIATHGFFLTNQPDDRTELNRLSQLENPLLRSGLALAGANISLKRQVLPPEAEDGLLTAEDVTGMDLLDTELVVLSACGTGIGQVHVGEGVFGLRRAFVLAGAGTLVMSLWSVPDEETPELIVAFYKRLLKGKSRAEALREAQLEMKKKYQSPYYWGAFVCQGDPGPLRGDSPKC
jgi:CHAT domain-containing protein/tetratricopeptide (TPR) repeat protein